MIFEKTYNGAVSAKSGRRSPEVDTFSDFEVTINGITQTLSGATERAYIWIGDAERTKWNDVTYTRARAQRPEISISNLSYESYGDDTSFPGATDYVSYRVVDREGNIRGIARYNYEASITTEFNYSSLKTEKNTIAVNIDLDFKKDYFNWIPNGVLEPSVPSYSISELGSSLQVSTSTFDDPSSLTFIDAVVKDDKPQWQTGQIKLQAADGSRVVLRPSPKDKRKVLIELNDSGETIEDFWSNGYTIPLPRILRDFYK